jgi:predicted small lipoprotein YifL
MKKVLLSTLVLFSLIALTACCGEGGSCDSADKNKSASEVKTEKCASGKCGAGKCGSGK